LISETIWDIEASASFRDRIKEGPD